MKIFTLSLLVVFACLNARATDLITATIAVTNAPLGNTNSLTINGNTRTFTNSVTASPATLIQQTNSIPWTATNVLNQLTDYRVSQFHFLSQSASTNVTIRGAVGEALTITLAGGWGKITYSTQSVQTPTAIVRVPMSVEYASNRAWMASALIDALNDYATNTFDTNATALSLYLSKGASPLQTVSSPVNLLGILRAYVGFYATNGFTSSLTNINPVSSNGVNYGNAFSSPNPAGTGGENFGNSANASGINSTALGRGATASGVESLAVGYGATATASSTSAFGDTAAATAGSSSAFGYLATASTNGGVALGARTTVTGENGIAIGLFATVGHSNSMAIGPYSSTTTNDEIRIGSSAHTVTIGGLVKGMTSTNETIRGTNILNGRMDIVSRANSSLANGYNSGVIVGTNTVVRFSGPSGAYTNAGFAAPGGPQYFIGQFDNPGLSFTILDQSGLDGTAANRIITGTGALLNSTNVTVMVQMLYDDSVSRWRILSFR